MFIHWYLSEIGPSYWMEDYLTRLTCAVHRNGIQYTEGTTSFVINFAFHDFPKWVLSRKAKIDLCLCMLTRSYIYLHGSFISLHTCLFHHSSINIASL